MKVIYTGSPSPVTVDGHKFVKDIATDVPDKLGALLVKKPTFKAAPTTKSKE